MGCAVHLWTGFVSVICYGTFLPTLPGFTPHHSMMTHAGVSGEAFQGVTLSFHLSNYQFTELIKNSAVRRLFSDEQVALTQKSSPDCCPSPLVFKMIVFTSFKMSFSLRI